MTEMVSQAGGHAVSVVDAEIYFHLNPEAFDRPEARLLGHILITHDDAQRDWIRAQPRVSVRRAKASAA